LIGAVDTVIVIPNERLMETVERGTSFFDAFRIADDILRQAVQGISDIITVPGIINRDFADVKAIMSGQGYAVMGTAVATGSNRAVDAANRAIASPLLEDNSIRARREFSSTFAAARAFRCTKFTKRRPSFKKPRQKNANIIFGAVQDETMKDAVENYRDRAGFKEANKKNTTQRPQFMPRTWKAGREEGDGTPATMAAAAGAICLPSRRRSTGQGKRPRSRAGSAQRRSGRSDVSCAAKPPRRILHKRPVLAASSSAVFGNSIRAYLRFRSLPPKKSPPMSFLPLLVRHIDRAGKCSEEAVMASQRTQANGRRSQRSGTCICRDCGALRTAAIGFRALLAVWPSRERVSPLGAGGDDRDVASGEAISSIRNRLRAVFFICW